MPDSVLLHQLAPFWVASVLLGAMGPVRADPSSQARSIHGAAADGGGLTGS